MSLLEISSYTPSRIFAQKRAYSPRSTTLNFAAPVRERFCAQLSRADAHTPDTLCCEVLDERIEEGLNACLCVTGVESESERISELETKLRHTRDSHQRAILIEAMESLLSPLEACPAHSTLRNR